MDRIVPLADALNVYRSEYDNGGADYSVTTLLDSPRRVHLLRRHSGEVEEFAEELINSMVGTAVHSYFEHLLGKAKTRYTCEARMFRDVLGRRISGAFDIVKFPSMWDIKTTKVWKAVFGDMTDWEWQQNIYRLLYRQEMGRTIKNLYIIGIFWDWKRNEKLRYGPSYPNSKAVEYRLPVFDFDTTEEFMANRVELMIGHEGTPDDMLPECTEREMWARETRWAVMTKGRKSALRLLPSEADARAWAASYNPRTPIPPKNYSFVCRPGFRVRCESYCQVSQWCNIWKKFKSLNGGNNDDNDSD
jgi:hypothetical protein